MLVASLFRPNGRHVRAICLYARDEKEIASTSPGLRSRAAFIICISAVACAQPRRDRFTSSVRDLALARKANWRDVEAPRFSPARSYSDSTKRFYIATYFPRAFPRSSSPAAAGRKAKLCILQNAQ